MVTIAVATIELVPYYINYYRVASGDEFALFSGRNYLWGRIYSKKDHIAEIDEQGIQCSYPLGEKVVAWVQVNTFEKLFAMKQLKVDEVQWQNWNVVAKCSDPGDGGLLLRFLSTNVWALVPREDTSGEAITFGSNEDELLHALKHGFELV